MLKGLIAVAFFLTTLIFSLLQFLLIARFFLRVLRISSLHPVAQTIFQFTNPLVNPIQKLLHANPKKPPRYDWACIIVLFIVTLIKVILLATIGHGIMLSLSYMLLFTLADIITQSLDFLFLALLIRIIMSWIKPDWKHPVNDILIAITNPMVRLGERIIPNVSGFNFGPYLILVVLKVITLFITASLPLPLL